MGKTTTPVGRLQVPVPEFHFDVDDDYGAALFATLTSAWTFISNNINTRWFGDNTIAAGAFLSIEHTFGLHLNQLKLYYHQSGTQLTKAEVTAKFASHYVDTDTITIENINSVEETFDLSVLSWIFDGASQIDLDALERLTASKAVVTDAGGGLAASTTTATELGYVSGVTSAIQTQLNANSAIDTAQTLRIDVLSSAHIDEKNPTGFVNVALPLTYQSNTRTCTVGDGNPFLLWLGGTRYTKTSESLAATSENGMHFFQYPIASVGSMTHALTEFTISDEAQVLFVLANSSCSPESFGIRETHGLMDWAAHDIMHDRFGSFTESGFDFSGYTLDNTTAPNSDVPTNAENTFAIASGTMRDEDLPGTVSAFSDGNGSGANHTHFYCLGTTAAWTCSQNFCFPYGTYPKYNKKTAGVWTLQEMTTPTIANPRWINIFVAVQLALDVKFEHLFIPGQNEYTSLSAAQGETWESLDKTWMFAPELSPIAKITFRGHNDAGWTGAGKCRIEAFEILLGTKNSRLSIPVPGIITNSTVSAVLAWQTNQAYNVGQVVLWANMQWECIVSHTSAAAFLTDFATPKWINTNAKIQNRQDNTSAVRAPYAADVFPSVANLQSATFTFGGGLGYEFIISLSTGEGISFTADYKSATINAISDPSGVALFADAGVGIVITKGANSAVITVKNRTGGAVLIGFLAVRGNITSATAWG